MKPLSPLSIKSLLTAVVASFVFGGQGIWAHQTELFLAIDPVHVAVEAGPHSQAIFSCRDVQWLNQAGEPNIPWQVITVLLPPDTSLGSVEVRLKQVRYEDIPGIWSVEPAAPEITRRQGRRVTIWPANKRIIDERDVAIYGTDTFWPALNVRLLSTGRLRKWRLAQVGIPLVRHNPVEGSLQRLAEGQLAVNFKQSPLTMANEAVRAELLDRIGQKTVRRLAQNFSRQYGAYETARKAADPAAGEESLWPAENGPTGYVIITTSAIQAVSAQLAAFAAHKQSEGFNVQVINETDFGGGTGDTAAENIRAWLQSHYAGDSIEYVLLIGDPHPGMGEVPMKMLDPRSDAGYLTPSDYYYSDLTGDWDLDGDGQYGEYNGDFGTGGVDRNWEVLVGRIPYYGSVTDLDSILQRIIAYETQPQEQTEWRKNVLLPMDDLGSGYPLSDRLGEDIKNDILGGAGWSYHRVYDSNILGLDPPPETMPCTKDNVVDVWGNGAFGLVVWWSHGSPTSAADVIDTNRVMELNDERKAFTFQASCNTARPEEDNNLTYELLQHGGICTIGGTRVSWSLSGYNIAGYATIEGMAYEYTSRVIPLGMSSGYALHELKQAIVPDYHTGGLWMNYLDFNIYGDPSTRIYLPDVQVHNLTQDIWYPVIQLAIDEALEGDEIVLNLGTYGGIGNTDLDFGGKAITVRSTDPSDPVVVANTVIDCGGTSSNRHRAFRFHNDENEDAVIDGLTIINGYESLGGAVYCLDSSPSITRCTFSGNTAISNGGVFYLANSDTKISHCTIIGNTAENHDYGGAIYISNGSPEVIDCIISDNSAPNGYGGAIYASGSGAPLIENCMITGNSAASGGAFYGGGYGSFTLKNCMISENSATEHGGGLYITGKPSLVNCIITGNTAYGDPAGSRGGGIYCRSFALSPTITNCTFSGNRADFGAGVCNFQSNPGMEIINSILWGDVAATGPEIAVMTYPGQPSAITVSHSDVQGGETAVYLENTDCTLLWQSGSDDDPLFVDQGFWFDNGTPGDPSDDIWSQGDYHLTSISTCIDQGNDTADELPDTDFEGDPRIVDGDNDSIARVDMGADELAGLSIESISFDPCISELCTSAISVTAYDSSGGNLSYSWEALDGGDIIGEGSDVEFDPPDVGPHPCPYQVKVTVTTDAGDLSADQTIDISVKLTGDVDGNGVVNVLDKVQVRNHFGESGDPGWIDEDVDCSGVVNVLDKVIVRNQFGQSGCACP